MMDAMKTWTPMYIIATCFEKKKKKKKKGKKTSAATNIDAQILAGLAVGQH